MWHKGMSAESFVAILLEDDPIVTFLPPAEYCIHSEDDAFYQGNVDSYGFAFICMLIGLVKPYSARVAGNHFSRILLTSKETCIDNYHMPQAIEK